MENRDQILLSIGRLEGKVDSLIAQRHDQRISALERRASWLIGAGAVAGAVLSLLIHFFLR